MNDMAARKGLEYLEVVHRPSGRTVSYACAWCGKLYDAQGNLSLAGGQIREHLDECEKKPKSQAETP
jgi:hypothetical protein